MGISWSVLTNSFSRQRRRKNPMNLNFQVSSAALLMLFSCVLALGQEFRGSITGKVTDPNGAVVPGATVVVRNVATNEEGTATTNDEGSY